MFNFFRKKKKNKQMASFIYFILDCIRDNSISEQEMIDIRSKAFDLLIKEGFEKIELSKIEEETKERTHSKIQRNFFLRNRND